jgi:hypothetical protein
VLQFAPFGDNGAEESIEWCLVTTAPHRQLRAPAYCPHTRNVNMVLSMRSRTLISTCVSALNFLILIVIIR